MATALSAPSSRDIPRRSPGIAMRTEHPTPAQVSIPACVASSIMLWISLRINPFWKLVPVPVIMAGAKPFCVRIGTCWAVGRSTPLKPMRARILQRSSNVVVEPVQTEAITLCLTRPLGAGVWADSRSAIPATRGAAAPVKNVLRSIGVKYTMPVLELGPIDVQGEVLDCVSSDSAHWQFPSGCHHRMGTIVLSRYDQAGAGERDRTGRQRQAGDGFAPRGFSNPGQW